MNRVLANDATEPLLAATPCAHDFVALALGKEQVYCALGTKKERAIAEAEGRVRWSIGVLMAKQAQLEQLKQMQASSGASSASTTDTSGQIRELDDAIKAQEALIAVTVAGNEIRQLVSGRAPMRADVLKALKVAVDIAPVVIEQFYRPSRLAAMIRVRRRMERVYDKTVHQVLQFICTNLNVVTGSAPPGAARRPVLLIGDWATSKKRINKFAFQRLIDRLAKKAIIVKGVNEHCTTRLCAMCGTTVLYPLKQGSKEMHNGTVYCPNTACPLRHSFLNRDVAAASNIVNRFLADMLMGGNLGAGVFGNSLFRFM